MLAWRKKLLTLPRTSEDNYYHWFSHIALQLLVVIHVLPIVGRKSVVVGIVQPVVVVLQLTGQTMALLVRVDLKFKLFSTIVLVLVYQRTHLQHLSLPATVSYQQCAVRFRLP